jgi:hypothetical protein
MAKSALLKSSIAKKVAMAFQDFFDVVSSTALFINMTSVSVPIL